MHSRPPPRAQVPAHVLAASRAVLGLHDPALRVAPLVGDSLIDARLTCPPGAHRLLVFARDDLCVAVMVRRTGDTARLEVRIDSSPPDTSESSPDVPSSGPSGSPGPPGPSGSGGSPGDFLEIVQPGERIKVPCPGDGVAVDGVPPGLTSIVLPAHAGPGGVRTAWFSV